MLFVLLSLVGCENIQGAKALKRDIPDLPVYCYSSDSSKKPPSCPEGADLLLSVEEIKTVISNPAKEEVTVMLFATNEIITLSPDDFKAKSINLLKHVGSYTQQVHLYLSNDGIANFASKIKFEKIKLTAILPQSSTVTNAVLTFDDLTLKSILGIAIEREATESNKLLETLTIDYVIKKMTTDPDSYTSFTLNQLFKVPKRDLVFIGVSKADFYGLGLSMTLYQGANDLMLFKTDFPDPIVISSDEPKATIEFVVTESSGLNSAMPFKISVKKGTEINANFEGNWETNKVVVDVPEGSKFIGAKKTETDKSPSMSYTGSGTATLDGNNVPVYDGSDGSQKSGDTNGGGGLSDGAIAGIIIVIIVVVIAAVVVVVVIIKKKKKTNVSN